MEVQVKSNPIKVSVIMIFYNAELYIKDAIESVLNQSFSNWELILVNDGSMDGSTAIAKAYASKYEQQVNYYHHPGNINKGTSASRNLGVQVAKGEYIVFLDADDVLLANKIERQVRVLDRYPDVAMVYGPSLYWYSWTQKPEHSTLDRMSKLGVSPDQIYLSPVLILKYLSLKGYVPCLCSLMVRKSVLDKINGFDESFNQLHEDQVLFAKITINYPVYVESECSAKYRQHCKSTCAVARSTKALWENSQTNPEAVYFRWLKKYVSAIPNFNKNITDAITKVLYPYDYPIKFMANEILQKFTFFASSLFKVSDQKEVSMGDLNRLEPFSREFGFDRGGAVDRYYIENFLRYHSGDIKGRVLEIKNNVYTKQFGGDQVSDSQILDIDAGNKRATIIADLTEAESIPSNSFDCVILTQVLQLIYDYQSAIKTIHRILKPGGVLLMTVPGITQIAYKELGETWFWSFSEASVRRMIKDVFGESNMAVGLRGNVLSATAFLYGMGAQEITKEQYEHYDPDYQVIITARAVKSG